MLIKNGENELSLSSLDLIYIKTLSQNNSLLADIKYLLSISQSTRVEMTFKLRVQHLIIIGLLLNLISQSFLSPLYSEINSSHIKASKNLSNEFNSVESVSINYTQPITNQSIPITILFPSSPNNITLPVLIYASGYFSRPGTIGYSAYFDYLLPIVQAGYIIVFPDYSMAYYEPTQQGGAEILIAIKNHVFTIWNNQSQTNVSLQTLNVGYIGISDGGGMAIIAGILDPNTQGVIAFTPYLTHSQLNLSLANFKPHLLAIGGTLDQGVTADKLDFLSELLDYNENQLYIIFKNCNHFGYYYDPYIGLSISLSIIFCNYVFKDESSDYQYYFGDDLFSHDLAYEIRILERDPDIVGRIVFVGVIILIIATSLFLRRRSKQKEEQIRLNVQKIREKKKLENGNKKHS